MSCSPSRCSQKKFLSKTKIEFRKICDEHMMIIRMKSTSLKAKWRTHVVVKTSLFCTIFPSTSLTTWDNKLTRRKLETLSRSWRTNLASTLTLMTFLSTRLKSLTKEHLKGLRPSGFSSLLCGRTGVVQSSCSPRCLRKVPERDWRVDWSGADYRRHDPPRGWKRLPDLLYNRGPKLQPSHVLQDMQVRGPCEVLWWRFYLRNR